MDNKLMRYNTGAESTPKQDRAVAGQSKQVYDDVRLAAHKVDGALALGAHMMEGLVALDQRRQQLAGGDPVLAAILGEIEANTIRQAKNIQTGLFNDWNL